MKMISAKRNVNTIAGIAAAARLFFASGLALADVNVWELPPGNHIDVLKRDQWKVGTTASKFTCGAAIENERLLLVALPGSVGPTLWIKSPEMTSRTELLITGTELGRITGMKLVDADSTDATLRLVTGSTEADFSLSAAKVYVEISPRNGAKKCESVVASRFALSPSFTEEDRLYDARQIRADVVPVPGRRGLLQLAEGGGAIFSLMWKDSIANVPDPAKSTNEEPETRNVALTVAHSGTARVFTSATVEFLGKSVYVGAIQGSNVWHAIDVRKLPGGKTVPLEWNRPFEAAWKVDMHVTDYDKHEITAFLKQAMDAGLSKERENDWRNAYLTLDENRKDTHPLRLETSFFKTARDNGGLPPLLSPAPEGDDRVWPFIFKGSDSIMTVPADWPCYPDPTKERVVALHKKQLADGEDLLWPIHVYGTFVIYPLDRTDKTALDRFTVVDLLRQALGIGPCKLDWLEKCN